MRGMQFIQIIFKYSVSISNKTRCVCVRFDVLSTVRVTKLFFRAVTLCSLTGEYQCFAETYRLHLQA
jgi:hypothetical protein